MTDGLQTCAVRAHRTLNRPLMLVAVDVQSDGSFNVQMAHVDLSRTHVAAIALDLMRLLEADILASDCSDCVSCQARLIQLQTAIAVLEADDAGAPF